MTKRGRTLSRDTRRILYALKNKWGREAEYYRQVNTVLDVNLESGVVSRDITKVRIRRMIISYPNTIQKFEYDIGFLAANKNFTYGGFYEPGDLVAIVTYSDLPNVDVSMEDYFYIDNKKYNIQRFQIIGEQTGWLLHLRTVAGSIGYRCHDKYVNSLVRFVSTPDGTI
jgi:hypothetical protein